MGRPGLPSVFFIVLLSVAVLSNFDLHSAITWATTSPLSTKGLSVDLEDLQQVTAGGDVRRRLLQVVSPGPAPGPDQSTSGTQFYIGYGALSASYCPCPPQTGRSYYTPDCESATGPVAPYTRGCSAITRCARE